MASQGRSADEQEQAAVPPADAGEAGVGEAPSLTAGPQKPVAFVPAAFDGDPGEVCGPDGCA